MSGQDAELSGQIFTLPLSEQTTVIFIWINNQNKVVKYYN
jgi:hypothetical protein